MEERSIKISLEKAREWYKSGSADLKEIALQAFSEKELKEEAWESIKTYEDACKALGIFCSPENVFLSADGHRCCENIIALYKINVIRKALNKNYKPSLVKGTVYYPWVRCYGNYDTVKDLVRDPSYSLCGKIKTEGSTYYLVGGDYYESCNGMGGFGPSISGGCVYANLGLLCCKSREIAVHMSKYFAKEIFDVVYIQHGNYKWLED
jgi:hypothetical protein